MSAHWSLNYLGAPWENGASGPGAYDCFGLVRAVYADRHGVEIPIVDVDAHAPLAVRHAMAEAAPYAGWRVVELDALEEGDVIVMSQARHPHHVGLWLAAGGVLHSVEGAGVVYQNRQSLHRHGWNLIRAYRRAL